MALQHPFGEKLRSVREKRGMTLKEVAERAGVSESLVSQIERNKVSPALDTLLSIADCLDIDLDYLFRDYKRERKVMLVKAGERRRMEIKGAVYEQLSRSVGDIEDHGIEAYLLTLAPGAVKGSEDYGHPGKELGLIVEGRGEFRIGTKRYELCQGDAISFAADLPHELVNSGDAPLKAFWVVTPPKGYFG